MFQSGHRRYHQDTDSPKRFGEDNWRFVLDDYAKTPPKPVLDGEPSYENIPHGLHDGTPAVLDRRRRAALRLLVGVRGRVRPYLWRQRRDAVPRPGIGLGPITRPRNYWFDAIDDPGAGQMRHLAALMLSRPYFERVHDPDAVASGSGPRREHVIAARGREYLMVYTHTGRPFEVRLGVTSGTSLRAWWYNSRDGSAEPAGIVPNSGTRRFTAPGQPGEGNDWVLVLDDATAGFQPPGR